VHSVSRNKTYSRRRCNTKCNVNGQSSAADRQTNRQIVTDGRRTGVTCITIYNDQVSTSGHWRRQIWKWAYGQCLGGSLPRAQLWGSAWDVSVISESCINLPNLPNLCIADIGLSKMVRLFRSTCCTNPAGCYINQVILAFAHKTRDSLKQFLFASCFGLSPAISSHFWRVHRSQKGLWTMKAAVTASTTRTSSYAYSYVLCTTTRRFTHRPVGLTIALKLIPFATLERCRGLKRIKITHVQC